MRLYNDIKDINNMTIKDVYLILGLEIFFYRLTKAKIFTIIDLVAGYWQVPLKKED